MRTLADLLADLNVLAEDHPELLDAPVMFAHQPRWPLQCSVRGPTVVCQEDDEIEELNSRPLPDETEEEGRERAEEVARLVASRTPIVYLSEGSSRPFHRRPDGSMYEMSPYAPRDAFGEGY